VSCTDLSLCEKITILKIKKRTKGWYVRIPVEAIRKLGLLKEDKVEVYIDLENKLITYKLSKG